MNLIPRANSSVRGTCARVIVLLDPCSSMELASRVPGTLAEAVKESPKACGLVPIALGICVNWVGNTV